MQQPAPAPDDRPTPTALEQETVELSAAALSLELSSQGLWTLIQQQGLHVLRLQRGGRSWSALTRVDHDHLLQHLQGIPVRRDPQLAPGGDVLDPLMERVHEAEERSLALEGKLLEMRTQAARSQQRAREARQQMATLRSRFEGELAASQAQLMIRARKLERVNGRRRSLKLELDRTREGYAVELEALEAERNRLRRHLAMASEVERAQHAYFDRHERIDSRGA